MEYISQGKIWRSEFYNNVSLKGWVHDINPNQLGSR